LAISRLEADTAFESLEAWEARFDPSQEEFYFKALDNSDRIWVVLTASATADSAQDKTGNRYADNILFY
ncbi:MAG: hypothetical protein WCJ77_04570, partial [Opitutae bacterium]